MDFTEKILSEKQIYKGKLLDVRKYEVVLPNGLKSGREVIKHIGASAVLAVDDEKNILLVRQYRFAAGDHLMEVPAGKFDRHGEDPLECARRELEEETGKKAEFWNYLGYILTTPGFTDEKIHLFLAKGLFDGKTNPDSDEFIQIIRVPLDEFEKMITQGTINDAKTIAVYARAKLSGGI
ncbi:MAG TPA: NUDIX hydrolase [Petrotogaceae bacterium]|jgi:ADP-ribose pyrophosphatase|nr:NUDIX hydrolase [Petrotogaceae bacterium]HQF32286.1 NUDIX hydrolase [Petrotogaceae bacterium]HQH32651.1 NUDIX hydrolase [Petrotogaceae bacterium]HQO12844.1 NUDIX hydrolase [Petrotogaceae bacterium]